MSDIVKQSTLLKLLSEKREFCVLIFQCEKPADVKKSKSCEADVPSDLRKEVESHYRLPLPEDFYYFWRFCEALDPEQPAGECSRTFLLLLLVEKAVGSWTRGVDSSQKRSFPREE